MSMLPIKLGELVRIHATELAPKVGLPCCECESHASNAVWDAEDVPEEVREWIKDIIVRGLQRERQRQRRYSNRHPKLDDLFRSDDEHPSSIYGLHDKNAVSPSVGAAIVEFQECLEAMPKDALQSHALEALFGRTDTPLTKAQLAKSASCSCGQAYRRLAKLDERIEFEVKRHLSAG
jgi:hypothetical protein